MKDIVDMWVVATSNLQERDLRVMERFIAYQNTVFGEAPAPYRRGAGAPVALYSTQAGRS